MPDFSHVLFGAILLVRPLSLWEPFADRVFILIGLFIAAAMRLLAAGQGGRPFRVPPAGLFLGAVAIAAAAFAFLGGPGVSRNGLQEAADLVSAGLLFLLAYDAGSDPARARRLVAVAMAALAISAIYGLLQIVSLDRLREMVPRLLRDGKVIPGLEGVEADQHKELLDRLFTRRIFGTFILPNLFGGFLAALLPVAAGLVIDNLRRAERDPSDPARSLWLVPAAAAAVAVPAFYLARSYGAWLALAAAAAAFAAMALRRLAPDHPAARAAPWALAAMLAAGVFAFGLLVSKPAPRDDESSFAQRVHYWKAGLKSFSEAPVAGHGLGRFAEEYMRFRPPEADETQRAHSAYVEWAVEGGAVLLALFLAWFVAIGRRAARGTALSDPAEAPARASLTALPEGVLAFLLLLVFQPVLFDEVFAWFMSPDSKAAPEDSWTILHAFLVAGCIAFLPAAFSAAARAAGAWTRIGIAAGGASFLVHASGEFVAQAPSVFHIVLALAAVAAAWAPDAPARDARGRRPLVLAFASLGAALAILVAVWQPAFEAERNIETAQRLRRARVRPDLIKNLLDAAKEKAPWDARPAAEMGDLFAAIHAYSRPGIARAFSYLEGTKMLNEALEIEPNSPGLHAQMGNFHERAADFATDADAKAKARAEAIRSYRRARALYPSQPHYAARLAILLGKAATAPAEKAAAQTMAREALDLDARTPAQRLQRLKLTAAEQKACEALATGEAFKEKPPEPKPPAEKAPDEKSPMETATEK